MKQIIRSCAPTILLLIGWAVGACSLTAAPDELPGAISVTQALSGENGQDPAQLLITSTPAVQTLETAAQSDFLPAAYSAENCSYGGKFLKIESLDALTVRFKLCSPEVAFLSKIAFPPFSIYPAALLEQSGVGKDSQLLKSPIGTGPYQVLEWDSGKEIRFTKFKGYWGEVNARSPELVFRWNPDNSQRLLELQTGTVQGIDSPNPADYAAVQNDSSLKWIYRAPLSVAFLGMNNTYPPFDNQLVRQAISLALDREAIVKQNFSSGYQTADFFTPCVISYGCAGEPWHETDPEKARQLLAQSGFPMGFKTQLSYRNVVRGYMDHPEQVAKEIKNQLKINLNIDVELIPIDSDDFLIAADDGLLPGLFLLGWGADYPDVSNFLDHHFGDQAEKMLGNPFNDIREQLRLGISTPDERMRQEHYALANSAIREHVPLIPIAHGGWADPQTLAIAFDQGALGAYADPMGFERFAEIEAPVLDEFVWMQKYEPLSLYCGDESDSDTLRACFQVAETLYRFKPGTVETEPALAEYCEPNAEMTVWTCRLRENVNFHDGSILDASDVVLSFAVQWDVSHPLHKSRMGDFSYFESFWGAFMNPNAP